MMLGILSDTHENLGKIARAVQVFNDARVALVLHAGDFISAITAREFGKLEARLVGVFGNNDGDRLFLTKRFEKIGAIYPDVHELTLDGVRTILMHEPKAIDALVRSGTYDLIVYGHTHEIDLREGPPVVINPGEAGGWLTGRATAVLLDTKTMIPRLVEL